MANRVTANMYRVTTPSIIIL